LFVISISWIWISYVLHLCNVHFLSRGGGSMLKEENVESVTPNGSSSLAFVYGMSSWISVGLNVLSMSIVCWFINHTFFTSL